MAAYLVSKVFSRQIVLIINVYCSIHLIRSLVARYPPSRNSYRSNFMCNRSRTHSVKQGKRFPIERDKQFGRIMDKFGHECLYNTDLKNKDSGFNS